MKTMNPQTTTPPLNRMVLQDIARTMEAGEDLGVLASSLEYGSTRELIEAIALSLGMEWGDADSLEVDEELLADFPLKLIHRFEVFPLQRRGEVMRVAVSNPFNFHAIDTISTAMRCVVQAILVEAEQLRDLIKNYLGVGAETLDGLIALRGDDQGDLLHALDGQDLEDVEMAQQASVVRLVNEILTEAIDARASDIHIESQEKGIKLRYRIDGVLQKQPTALEMNQFRAAIVSRLKIMAKMNIAEKRVPQDGRIKLRMRGREVDIRVSVIPMLHGEGIVMRVLDKNNLNFSLRGIGMPEGIYGKFQDLIRLPHGIVLVTGPTGSGKTTTLYSALSEIRSEETKIITTEDPIEYQLEGINQIQVHAKVGLTFAASLRSILRHDPDVVLVGEIRDLETAENATQASLTGHLVFSTLHTNDAASAFMRLCDMGVEPFLVSSTVEGVLAQRLVRRLCPDCCAAVVPSNKDVPADFPWDELERRGSKIFSPVGCPNCRGNGYRGRVGIYELLTTNAEIRELISRRAPTDQLKLAAQKTGMTSLREDGWQKVLDGITTVAEVMRVSKE